MGLIEVSRGTAALRLARNRAQKILEAGQDPLKHTHDFERLWIEAGYPTELALVGNLDDEVYIMNQSDEVTRKWIIERLKEFMRTGGPT